MKVNELIAKIKNVPSSYAPAYAWCWNTDITRKGVARRIDEMAKCGIEAFYIIPIPKNFRPDPENNGLTPEYLSKDYLELLLFAHCYAKEKGMHTWLYNEGGWPSGMACGAVLRKDITLGKKIIIKSTVSLPKGEAYTPSENALSAFAGERRVMAGEKMTADAELTEYCWKNAELGKANPLFTDIADERTTQLFLELTHERMKNTLGDMMGTDMTYMFDDESMMGSYTENMQEKFRARFGYEMEDYLPYLVGGQKPETMAQKQAKMDYARLCGELVRENYFLKMKTWLNRNNMKSVGHLDYDNETVGFIKGRYGSFVQTLRAFDVPGVDVIWGQIFRPKAGSDRSCTEGLEFFPRFASSAARQNGDGVSLSESGAVYGGQTTHADMRYVVNFQAVRGINQFNINSMSYRDTGISVMQSRPVYIPQFLGTELLGPLNTYIKRLSYLLQNNTPWVKTALYLPSATIASGGEEAEAAIASFEAMGNMLEAKGVDFDVIDEYFVLEGELAGTALTNGKACYENIFVPECAFEPQAVMEKLAHTKTEILPTAVCDTANIMVSRVDSEDAHCYFVYNENAEEKTFAVSFNEIGKNAYRLNLTRGELQAVNQADGKSQLTETLGSGDGVVYIFTQQTLPAEQPKALRKIGQITDFTAYMTREFAVTLNGPVNTYFSPKEKPVSGPWEKAFSGEITYEATVDFDVPAGQVFLDLGKVETYARVYVDDCLQCQVTMPPYVAKVENLKKGSRLKIAVTNTVANAFACNAEFNALPPEIIGPYNYRIVAKEEQGISGGFGENVEVYM